LRSSVRLIEAVSPQDHGQDAPILTELLKMAEWGFSTHSIKGKTPTKQKENFLRKLTEGNERFVHISAHGGRKGELVVGNSCVSVTGGDVAAYCRAKTLPPNPLKNRFITLSACGEISGRLPLELHEASGLTAIISPLVEVGFAESAVFMILFYFALAKSPKLSGLSSPASDKAQARTSRRIAHYIDSFQRTKLSYLGIGGTGAFRLDYWWQDEHLWLH